MRLLTLLLVSLLLVGCGRAPGVAVLSSWQLDTETEHGVPITLPTHIDDRLPRRRTHYELRARVELSEALRGRTLTLAIPMLQAPCVLLADGKRMAPLDVGTTSFYRGARHPRWSIPSELTTAPSLDLELQVEHTWTQSAWLDTPPRLSATPEGDPAYLAAMRITDGCALLGFASVAVTVLMYLLMFLADRSRTAYGWWAVEAAAGLPYTVFVLGVVPPLVGTWDAAFMSFALCLSIWGGVKFTHLQFGLPPPHKAWNLAPLVCATACVFFGGPFWSTRVVTPITVVAVLANITYQLTMTLRLWRGTERRMQALELFIGWGAVGVIGAPDFVAWMGLGEVAGGAHPACLGIALIAILQSVVLSNDYVASLRRMELLNAELRRQIAARSEHLAQALSRLTVTEGQRPRELTIGETVDGRYRVVGTSGRGGMGVVYQVERMSDGHKLALKLLANAGASHMARFAREAQLVARLDHPNIVTIVDVDVASSGFFYIVMEYVTGRSLEEHRKHFGDLAWALHVLRQIADGLAAVHAHGIVHRDLKPANVLVSPGNDAARPRVKIADFGISRVAETTTAPIESGVELAKRHGLTPTPGMSIAGSNTLTQTGVLMGTPRYMAPELVGEAKLARAPSDVFSFGVIAYELLTKTLPFKEPAAVMCMNGDPIPKPAPLVARSSSLDAELAALIERCLAEDETRRPTAAELSAALAKSIGMVA